MTRVNWPVGIVRLLLVLGMLRCAVPVAAQSPQQATNAGLQTRAVNRLEFVADSPSGSQPLTAVLKYVRTRQAFIRDTVQDFQCRVSKRERIDGELKNYEYFDLDVREEMRQGDEVLRPLSVFVRYLAPRSLEGRRVLYVAGQNSGQMVVRKGGRRFGYVVVKVDPLGAQAQERTRVPINEIGLFQMFQRWIVLLEQHLQADPSGKNTRVRWFAGAKVNKRSCTVIQVTHPLRHSGLKYHLVTIYVDDGLRVPTRIEAYDWPSSGTEAPPLVAEYSYTDIALNVGLSDADFDLSRVAD